MTAVFVFAAVPILNPWTLPMRNLRRDMLCLRHAGCHTTFRMCICLWWVSAMLSAGVHRAQKKGSQLLELEIQAVVNHTTLEIKFWFSRRPSKTPESCNTSPGPLSELQHSEPALLLEGHLME